MIPAAIRPKRTGSRSLGREGSSHNTSSEKGATSPHHGLSPAGSMMNLNALLAKKSMRMRIYLTMEDPQFSLLARSINIFVLILIIFSTTTFLVETLPDYDPREYVVIENGQETDILTEKGESLDYMWNTCETVVVAIFTVEYCIRLFTCPKLFAFIINKLNIIDILAILPFYIEMILEATGAENANVSNFRFLRTIRLFRVFRLFKLSKHSEHFVVFMETLRKSRDALLMLTFILCLTVIIFAGVMHIIEKAEFDPETGLYRRPDNSLVVYDPFRSVPEAAWWAVATLTTVGYGDAVPVTAAGKAVAPVAMLAGILTIAMPLGIIGENLMESYRQNDKLTNARSENVITNGERDPTMSELVHFMAITREEISYLFVSLEDTLLRLRKKGSSSNPTTAREGVGSPSPINSVSDDEDSHAFNNVEQCLFENVVRGIQSLEIHLTQIDQEMKGERSSQLRDALLNAMGGASPAPQLRRAGSVVVM